MQFHSSAVRLEGGGGVGGRNEKEPVALKAKQDWTTRAEFAPGEEPKRFSMQWNWDMLVKFCVFGVTGSATMFFARPLMTDLLNIEGSMWEGGWDYRIASFLSVTPIYSVILLSVASIAGRRTYFQMVVQRMWSRVIPKSIQAKWFKK